MKKNNNNKGMCVVFYIIEHVFGCSRVTLVSMLVDGSSYVSFPKPSFFLYSLYHVF